MNIFVLDRDPEIAASYLCDIHLNKMQVESAQMLANCFTPVELESAPRAKSGNVRKHSYWNHPCSKWTRANIYNALWLARHALSMDYERAQRFENSKQHFSYQFNLWAFWKLWHRLTVDQRKDSEDYNLLNFDDLVAIPIDAGCRRIYPFDSLDVVSKYRLYYAIDKAKLLKYTNADIPHFLRDCVKV